MKDGRKGTGAFKGLLSFCKMCYSYDRWYVFQLILLQVFKAASSLTIVIIPQYIIDATFLERDIRKAVLWVAGLCGTIFVLNVFSALGQKNLMIHRMTVYKKVQLSISKMMMEVDYELTESETFLNTKAKAERFLFGDGRGFGYVLENSFELLSNVITLAVLCGVITTLNPLLLIVILTVLAINTYINARTQKKAIVINMEKSLKERMSAYYSDITQNFRYGMEIRGTQSEEWIQEKYDDQLSSVQKFYKRLAGNNCTYESIVSITGICQQLASYLFVVYNGVKQRITAGQFSMYLSSVSTFSSTLRQITAIIVGMQQYTQYYAEYEKYIAYGKTDRKSYKSVGNAMHRIDFVDVSFKYNGQSSYALKNVNLTINEADRIMIVGENGAGKSTLIKLLLGIYRPTEGKILLNGVDISNYSQKEYRSLFATVFQDYKLFDFSLEENIAMRKKIDKGMVRTLLNAVGLEEKVLKLKNGTETTIYRDFDKEGYNPSGGEGQKIVMCRALYKNSQIIVLDEPSSALDPKAEAGMYEMFDSLFSGKTTIYISHRLASAKLCNRVVSLKDGMIAEDGTHDELIKKGGLYASLFSLQAAGYAL